MNDALKEQGKQASGKMAQRIGERLEEFVKPLLVELDNLLPIIGISRAIPTRSPTEPTSPSPRGMRPP